LPGEEDRRSDGIVTSGESAAALGDRGANLGADRTRVTRSAPRGNDAQRRSSGVSAPTTITATATPRQQFVGHDITIAGQLTANGAPVAEGLVKLYSDGVGLWYSVGDTTTNARGGFAFRVTQPSAGTRSFKVAYSGSPTYEPSVSDELSVTYVTIPTTITATASPRQQFVGRDVTITGRLLADGTTVANAPITLYNADDIIELVSVATTATDAAGDYQFTLTATTPSHHIYVVRSSGDSTHARVQSAEISVTYVTIPTTITATASPRQQFVGRDVTITGTLTADGTPVAETSVTLYKTDAAEKVLVATTTTDASGYYQFTLTATTPSHHTYVVRVPGDSTYVPVHSAEISVTYVTIPTTITATASPRQQFVGRDVTITGRLLADGIPVADAPITLYNADDIIERILTANTTTDASGYYQFTLTDTAPSHHSYVVRAPGSPTYEPSVSDELPVTYVTIPTTITATASPRQQFVGRDVTITGQLTASGAELVGVPVVLYNTEDPKKKVLTATTTTDASGHYQFTLTDSVATTHAYAVCAEGDSTYSRVQSTEILVTYATRAAEALAVRARTVLRAQPAFNLSWSEFLAIFLILAGEGLLFAGYRVAGVGVQALNLIVIFVMIVVLNGDRVELLEVLALVSLLRVINLSFALIPTVTLYWLVAIYGVMFIPIIMVVAHRKLSRHDLGLTGGLRVTYLIPIGILIGVALALVEYRILANPALIPSYSLVWLVELSVVMIFVVTLVEELIFRALLQPELVQRSGPIVGILITSIIFGALQSGFANYYELLFAFGVGLVFGVAFYKTKNLPFVITMHAMNNILLFGVLPFLPMIAVLH
jgi:membrane protease YdiL (CAAX protease family)/5-hydroxyisourate hydrolase-like protein (transthyretin family)